MSRKRRLLKPSLYVGAALVSREAVLRRRDRSIAGQRVLITGGSRGLGLALARQLLDEGCRVAICARDTGELEAARKELAQRAGPDAVLAIECDVTDRVDVDRMVAEVTASFGGIDILINNAGLVVVSPAQLTTEEDIQRALDLMLWHLVHTAFAVVPQMRERGEGQIVNVTSFGGKLAVPHLLAYSTAKFAAVGFSSGLATELRKHGVHVTTVCPSEIQTGSHTKVLFKGRRDEEYRWFALGAAAPWTQTADRAAARIIQGIRRREVDVTFPWTVRLAVAANGISPSWTTAALRLADKALPSPEGGDTGIETGAQVEARKSSRIWDAATTQARDAAERHNNKGAGPDVTLTMPVNGLAEERTLGEAQVPPSTDCRAS